MSSATSLSDSSPGSSVAQATSASNSLSQSSSTVQATSASPTTSPTPATTAQQSNPGQTTSAAAQTTSSSHAAGSSDSLSSTAALLTTSSSFTSQVATTFSSTDAAGSVVLVTSTVPEIVTTSITSNTSHSSSNNTGVIVGAVVGGVVGIIALVLLLFCVRRRTHRDEFDGNFDPDRVVGHAEVGGGTLPHVDLAEEVTPFPPSQPHSDQGSASMRQYGKSPYIPVPSSLGASERLSAEFYPSGTVGVGASSGIDGQSRLSPPGAYAPPVNMYGTGPVDWYSPHPGASPPPSTVSNTTGSMRAAKEREAMGRTGQGIGLTLATQQEAAEGSGDVVVHRDAGRAPIEEHVPPREIPPAYESIRRD